MKKIIIAAIILAFAIPIITYSAAGTKKSAKSVHTSKNLTGLVINVTNEYVEIKIRKKEIILHIADSSKFYSIEGKAENSSIVEICQKVKASYKKQENKNILVSLKVLGEGYCKK